MSSLPDGRPANTRFDRQVQRLGAPYLVEIISVPYRKLGGWYCGVAIDDGPVSAEMPIMSPPHQKPDFPEPSALDDERPRRIYGIAVNYSAKGSAGGIILGVCGVFGDRWTSASGIRGGAVDDETDIGIRAIIPYVHDVDRGYTNEGGRVLTRLIARGSIKNTEGENKFSGDGDLMLWVSDIKPNDYYERLQSLDKPGTSSTKLYTTSELGTSQARLRVGLVGNASGFRIGKVQKTVSKQGDWSFSATHSRGIPFDVSKSIFDGVFLPADERVPLGGALVQNYLNAGLCSYVGMLGKQVSEMAETFERIGHLLNDALGNKNDANSSRVASNSRNKILSSGLSLSELNYKHLFTIQPGTPGATSTPTVVTPSRTSHVNSVNLSKSGLVVEKTTAGGGVGPGTLEGFTYSLVTPKPQAVEYLYAILWEIGSAIGGFKLNGRNKSESAGEVLKGQMGSGSASDTHFKKPLIEKLNESTQAWADKVTTYAPRTDDFGAHLQGAVLHPNFRRLRMYIHPDYHQQAYDAAALGDGKSTRSKFRTYVETPPYAWWEKCLSPVIQINPISMDPNETESMELNTTVDGKSYADKFFMDPRTIFDGKVPDDLAGAEDD